MLPQQDIQRLKSTLEGISEVVILFGDKTDNDGAAAALALYLSLSQAGKRASIASPRDMLVEQSNLIGINKVGKTLGNKNFVISLDYTEDSIEKVSYHVEGSKFNLVIEPRVGAPQLSEEKVSFAHSGFSADAIIIVGTQQLEQLGSFYEQNKVMFADKPTVVIDTKLANRRFGQINIVTNSASVSELMYQIIKELQLPLNPDVATNLYSGINAATSAFSSQQTTPETFEAVAQLLRAGAKKSWGRLDGGSQQVQPRDSGTSRPFFKNPNPQQPQQQQEERPQRESQAASPEAREQTPPDWLKPKIFKGSNLV